MRFVKDIKNYLSEVKKGRGAKYRELFKWHLRLGWRASVRNFTNEYERLVFTQPVSEKEYRMILGLNKLLSKLSFSILISVKNPSVKELKNLLDSIYLQTCPKYDVIIEIDEGDRVALEPLFREYPELKFNREPTHDYIVILDPSDWIRCDFLYRYEQLIQERRTKCVEELSVFHTAPVELDAQGFIKAGSLALRPLKPEFPYEFAPLMFHGLAMPLELWRKWNKKSWHDLDLKGAIFYGVPLPVMAIQSVKKNENEPDFKRDFADYTQEKNLNWEIASGLTPYSLRAIPILSETPYVQVIMPFKNSRHMTLSAVKHVLNSTGVKVHVTAVDNGSDDQELLKELSALGCEVMQVNEPFNYSRLNNLAAANTVNPCPLILFLNNDADLDPEALQEMARWIHQPGVGIVGCRLHYPSGRVQHAGVELNQDHALPGAMGWIHPGILEPFENLDKGKRIHIAHAVTAAAALITRENFFAVKGFDENLYPVAYSDTNLAVKLSKKGLKPLYTPFAKGVHHESASRVQGVLEDFDRSCYLHNFSF